MCGSIRRTLSRKTRKETGLKFYKVIATPMLLYGSEMWVTNQKQLCRIQPSEMRFLRSVKGCTRQDRLYNEDICGELNVFKILNRIRKKQAEMFATSR